MSVATEFSSTVFDPRRAGESSPPMAPARRPRLRLVPPAQGCVPGSRRVGGSRRGAVRVAGSVQLAPAARRSVTALEASRSEGIAAGQFEARPLRLTRRGVVASAVGVVLVGGLLLLVAYLSAGSAGVPAPRPAAVPGSVVTVQPGDTLWSIAGQVAPGHDPRRVVEQIREVNHLSSASLTPGQTLKVG
jgi:LysM repeat protein